MNGGAGSALLVSSGAFGQKGRRREKRTKKQKNVFFQTRSLYAQMKYATAGSGTPIYLNLLKHSVRSYLEAFPLSVLLQERGTRVVATALKDSTLEEVRQIMAEREVGCCLITNDGHQPIGIINRSDVELMATLERLGGSNSPKYLQHCVGDHMKKDLMVGSPTMSLSDAMIMLATRKGRHLPIASFVGDSIDGDTRIVDVISTEDILLFLTKKYD